jgi:hypothetical protein
MNIFLRLHLKRINYIITIVLLTVTIISCSPAKVKMYKGAEVEYSKQAIIRADVQEERKGIITILQVNGEYTRGFLKGVGASEVYLLPGKHELVARLSRGTSYGFSNLWLIAEAGETYIVKARIEGYSVKMWLENARTGQKVGGEINSGDKPKEK